MTTPQQPINSGFTADSTIAEVLEGIDLTGRLAIVTGGYSGIGTEVTRGLSDAGATVVVPARRPDQARKVIGDVAGVEIAELDLADLGSVERFADGFLSEDPRLTGLVGELSVKSEDFRQMWARHDVRARISGRKRYNNPFIGLITLDYETFTVNAEPGQTLFVFRAEPGSGDEHSLLLLAQIAAGSQVGSQARSQSRKEEEG